jgi:hypothetical protein
MERRSAYGSWRSGNQREGGRDGLTGGLVNGGVMALASVRRPGQDVMERAKLPIAPPSVTDKPAIPSELMMSGCCELWTALSSSPQVRFGRRIEHGPDQIFQTSISSRKSLFCCQFVMVVEISLWF